MHEVAVEEAFFEGGVESLGSHPSKKHVVPPLMVLRILHCNNYHPWDYNWFQANVVHLLFSCVPN